MLPSVLLFLLFSALYISPPHFPQGQFGLSQRRNVGFQSGNKIVYLLSRQRLFSQLRTVCKHHFGNQKLGEMGNLIKSFLLAAFLDSPCVFSAIFSVTNLTFHLFNCMSVVFSSQYLKNNKGIKHHILELIFSRDKLLIFLLFYTGYCEFPLYVSPQSLYIPQVCTTGNKNLGNIFPIVGLHPDPMWLSCSLLLITPPVLVGR